MRLTMNLPSPKKNNKKRGLAKVLFFHHKQKAGNFLLFFVIYLFKYINFLAILRKRFDHPITCRRY